MAMERRNMSSYLMNNTWNNAGYYTGYYNKDEELKSLRKEVHDLRKQHLRDSELLESWKKDKEHLHQQEVQLKQVTDENESLRSELDRLKESLKTMRNRDLELARAQWKKHEEELLKKTQVLEQEVKKLWKTNSSLESMVTNNIMRAELVRKGVITPEEKQNCCELKEQLMKAIKNLEPRPPESIVGSVPWDDPKEMIKVFEDNRMLQNRLVTRIEQLSTLSRQLDKKDRIIERTKKKCEELRQSLTEAPPPGLLLPECQWVIREQNERIKALMGQVGMLQMVAKEYKRAVEVEETNRKLYLKEKKRNMDLSESLRKKELEQQQPGDKPGATELPPVPGLLEPAVKQAEIHIQTLTPDSIPLRPRPPSTKKPRPESSYSRTRGSSRRLTVTPVTPEPERPPVIDSLTPWQTTDRYPVLPPINIQPLLGQWDLRGENAYIY